VICKQCGTEIADKAIICYRCGAATTDPVRKPADVRSRRGRLVPLVGLVLLVLLGLFLGQAGRTVAPAQGDRLDFLAGICIGAAVLILLLRIIRRRRK
jgi:hypothetical protein